MEAKKTNKLINRGKLMWWWCFFFWDDGCEKENYYQWQLNYRALFAFLMALRLNNFCLFVFACLRFPFFCFVYLYTWMAGWEWLVGWSSGVELRSLEEIYRLQRSPFPKEEGMNISCDLGEVVILFLVWNILF